MRTAVRDDFIVEAKVEVDFMEEKGCYSFSSDGLSSGTKNHPLSKAMVDHDQKGIKARGEGKIGDKVTRDLLERASAGRANGGERGNSGMGVGFVLLAGCTALNIFWM